MDVVLVLAVLIIALVFLGLNMAARVADENGAVFLPDGLQAHVVVNTAVAQDGFGDVGLLLKVRLKVRAAVRLERPVLLLQPEQDPATIGIRRGDLQHHRALRRDPGLAALPL